MSCPFDLGILWQCSDEFYRMEQGDLFVPEDYI